MDGIILAAKCAPEEQFLSMIAGAGIGAVEVYTDLAWLRRNSETIPLLEKYPFLYAVHAPAIDHVPEMLAELACGIGAKVVVLHDIYWQDEWERIVRIFEGSGVRLCVENHGTIQGVVKIVRRLGIGFCLDLEHLQLECNGVIEDEFPPFVGHASHIHLTGYEFGSENWHTHIHHTPEHGMRMLDIIAASGYKGMVVSEAKRMYQSPEEFRALREFFDLWRNRA